jgi:hypothetical protein
MWLFCLRRRAPVVLKLCAFMIMLVIASTPLAWAQTTAAATTVDLSPVVQWLLGLLSLGGTALAGMATTWLYAKLGISKDSAAAAAIQAAEQKAGAIAYSFIASQGAKITNVSVKNQAIAVGANFMMTEIPAALARMGVSQASVLQRSEAELGKLLAGDPTVSVGAAAPAAGPVVSSTTEAAAVPVVSAIAPIVAMESQAISAVASGSQVAAALLNAVPVATSP